jgi:hypothetical protein
VDVGAATSHLFPATGHRHGAARAEPARLRARWATAPFIQPIIGAARARSGERPGDRSARPDRTRRLLETRAADQYAFERQAEAELRRLFTRAIISVRVQRFRDTGVISFQTRMELFVAPFRGIICARSRVRTSSSPSSHGPGHPCDARGLR